MKVTFRCHGLDTYLIMDIIIELFSDKMENSCDPRAYCPPNCTCSGTIVRCIKQNLKYFPKDIPMDTTDL